MPITGVSRMAPSLSTPATPRTLRRSARMSPSVPERVLPSVPITSTWPAGVSSIASRCALGGSAGRRRLVEILAARNVAQRVGRPDQPRRLGIERPHAADRAVAKAALQHLHRDGGRAGIQEVLDGLGRQRRTGQFMYFLRLTTTTLDCRCRHRGGAAERRRRGAAPVPSVTRRRSAVGELDADRVARRACRRRRAPDGRPGRAPGQSRD